MSITIDNIDPEILEKFKAICKQENVSCEEMILNFIQGIVLKSETRSESIDGPEGESELDRYLREINFS